MLMKAFAVLSAALIGTALADSSSSSTATSTAPAATHTVSVGADGFNFSPHELNALVGDIIEFRFYPLNHSVAKAAFGPNPCIPYEDTGAGRVGFWSGFFPMGAPLNDPPIFRVPINDTQPVFFYCSAPGACLQGMIGVINPNATFNYTAQFGYTQTTQLEFSPMEYFPVESAIVRTTTATGATTTPTIPPSSTSTPPAAATTTGTAPPVTSKSSSLPTGAIVGIAIGGFAVVVLAAALLYMCGRQKTVKELLRQSHPPQHSNSYVPTSPGMSEALYSNQQKLPTTGAHYSGQSYAPGTETESYRSMSPPADERAHMIPGMIPSPLHYQNGQMSPPSMPVSPGYPSPTYTAEMEHAGVGMRPYNPDEGLHAGIHEMAVPSRNPSTGNPPTNSTATEDESRPFSYTDSESGYRDARGVRMRDRDEKVLR